MRRICIRMVKFCRSTKLVETSPAIYTTSLVVTARHPPTLLRSFGGLAPEPSEALAKEGSGPLR